VLGGSNKETGNGSSNINNKENANSEGNSGDNSFHDNGDVDGDDKHAIDETVPFSPLFQSKTTKPMIWENVMDSNGWIVFGMNYHLYLGLLSFTAALRIQGNAILYLYSTLSITF